MVRYALRFRVLSFSFLGDRQKNFNGIPIEELRAWIEKSAVACRVQLLGVIHLAQDNLAKWEDKRSYNTKPGRKTHEKETGLLE